MTRLSFLPLALLAGAALGLSACVGGPASLGGEPPLTPASRYALQVETGLDRIALAVHDDGLSANQNAALAALVERFAAVGAGSITIEAPAGDDPVAAQTAYAVRDALADNAHGQPSPSACLRRGRTEWLTMAVQKANAAQGPHTCIITEICGSGSRIMLQESRRSGLKSANVWYVPLA